jgi:predicted LPLAT superfamily acyltransferase
LGEKTRQAADSHDRMQRHWSVQGVGKRWQLAFFHKLIRLGGRRPAYHIMYVVVFGYMLFVPAIRRRTQPYLRRRFPGHRNPLRRFWDSYRLVCTFGRTMIDRAAFAILGPNSLRASCPDAAAIHDAVRGGAGAVLINAHVGCWQVALTIVGLFGKEASMVMLPPDTDSPQGELLARSMPFRIIDPRNGLESVIEMLQSLKRGEILGVMGDRVFGSGESTVPATFLGGEIELPFSPYRLAGAAGAPMIVLFSHKTAFSHYEVRLARVIHASPDARTPESCRPFAQEFADALEEFAQEHPWQFFNFYDLWHVRDQNARSSDSPGGAS